ncbi:MAG: hypothetical protein AAFR61_08310 [Bacteroidota bacterium]
MIRKYAFTILLSAWAVVHAQQADVFDEKQTSANNIAGTITNLGIIGNSFSGSFSVEGFSSWEYPANSGVEHIFDGGLWVGGIKNGEVLVTTGAVDDASGYTTGKRGFEFASKAGLQERSSLRNSPFFNPTAISHQDFTSTFTDTSTSVFTGANNIPIIDHVQPLGIKVDFQAFNWSFSFTNFFVILNFKITNIGNTPIDSVFVGYWMDGVIRNVNITPPGGGAFFNKGGNGFVDSLNMGYEFDATGDIGFTDSYVASKFLGLEYNGGPAISPNFKTHYNSWQFRNSASPLYFFPTTDLGKYDKMSNGLNYLSNWPQIQVELNNANNRSNLVAAGPVSRFNPGDEIEVAFAIICARREKDGLPATANTPFQRSKLLQNASWAQAAYNGEDVNGNSILDEGEDRDRDGEIDRFILPVPPDIPNTRIVSGDHKIEVYWADNSEASVDPISKRLDFEGFRLYKTKIGFDVQETQDILASLQLIGEWDVPGNGLFFDSGFEPIRLEDPVTFPGDTNIYVYKYTFENIANGWQHGVVVTAYDTGDDENNLESLESPQLGNLFRVFPGKPANDGFENGDPFVYPNPYYARADWEGSSRFEEDRKLIFANLPKHCEIRIYTLAGDLVDVIQHDESYDGSDTRWFDTYSDTEKTTFSGGEHAWDLLSADNQIIARGLYLFVVRNLDTDKIKRGKFVIIK